LGRTTAQEELWNRQPFTDFASAAPALAAWQRYYNYYRVSLALQGQTPAEKLALRLPSPNSREGLRDGNLGDGTLTSWGPHRNEIEELGGRSRVGRPARSSRARTRACF